MKLSYKNKEIFINEIDGVKQVDFNKVADLVNDSLYQSGVSLGIDNKITKCSVNYNFSHSILRIYEMPYIRENKVKYEIKVNINGQLAQVESIWKDIEVLEATQEEVEEAKVEGIYLREGETDI